MQMPAEIRVRVKFDMNTKTDRAVPYIPVGHGMQQPCKIRKMDIKYNKMDVKWAVLTERFAVCTTCTSSNTDQRQR